MQTIRLFLLIALACLVTLPSAQAAPFVSPNGYSVTPAPQWQVNHSGVMGMDVFIYTRPTDGFAPNLNAVIGPTKPGETLEQAQGQIAAMYPRMFTQFHMIKTGYETVGDARALFIIATHLQGMNHLSLRQDFVLRNGKVYTFTCTALTTQQARYAPAFTQMLHSVRWSR